MHGGVHDVHGIFAATHDVLYFAQARVRNLLDGAGEAVDAANFLHGSRRDGEYLAADAKENDLLGARSGRLDWRIGAHYLTPTGVDLQMPITRFSMAAQMSSMARTLSTAPNFMA